MVGLCSFDFLVLGRCLCSFVQLDLILAQRPGLPMSLGECRAGSFLTRPLSFVSISPWFGHAGGGEQRWTLEGGTYPPEAGTRSGCLLFLVPSWGVIERRIEY